MRPPPVGSRVVMRGEPSLEITQPSTWRAARARPRPSALHAVAGDRALIAGVAILAFAAPFDGFYDLSTAIGVSPVTLIGYLVAVMLIPAIPDVLRRQSPASLWFAGAFACGSALTVIHSLNSGGGIGAISTAWQMVALLGLVTAAASSDRGYRAVRAAVAIGLATCCVAYLILYQFDVAVSHAPGRIFTAGGYQANQAGEAAAVALILVITLLVEQQGGRWSPRRLFQAAGIAAALAVLALTNSRGATLMATVGVLALMFARRPAVRTAASRVTRPSRAKVWVLVSAIAVSAIAMLGSEGRAEVFDRFAQRWLAQGDLDTLTTGRTRILTAGLEISRDYPQGLGLGRSSTVLAERADLYRHNVGRFEQLNAHNEFLRVLLESGWAGFLLFVGGWVYLLRGAWHRFLEGRPELLAIMLALSVSFNTGTAGSVKLSWILLGLVAAAVCRACAVGPAPAYRRAVGQPFRTPRHVPLAPRSLG